MSTVPVTTPVETDIEPPVSLWRDAWHRLRRNRLAVFGLIVVIILAFTRRSAPI